MTKKTETIVWEADLQLFSRRMLGQWSFAMLLTAGVIFVIMGTIFVAEGDWDTLLPVMSLISACVAGLWLLGMIIMAVLFRGKVRVRYTLSDQELRYETIDRKVKAANLLAIVIGVLARSPQTAGAGLTARSQEAMTVRWSGAFRAQCDPVRHHITLRNEWRALLWVQCTPENYAAVATAVERNMARRETAQRVAAKSPLPAYLGRTALVVLGCLPLFALADEYNAGVFMPIFILCFGLATVWMINLFGYVVLGGLLVEFGLVVADMMRLRKSFFFKGETYYGYEVLGTEDYQLLLVACIGAGILVWQSLAAVRGRWLSALLDGYKDMG